METVIHTSIVKLKPLETTVMPSEAGQLTPADDVLVAVLELAVAETDVEAEESLAPQIPLLDC